MKLPHIIACIFDSLEAHLKEQQTVIIGVSGGPDSTCLLKLVLQFAQKYKIKIVVAHVNHGIRSDAAYHDENFVKKLAKKYDVDYSVKRVTLSGSGLEEKGRKVRRAFFEKLARVHNASAIITAHTLDDQLETIIFNMIRGAYVSGMAGMREKDGIYLKPFLKVSKKEILEFLKKHRIPFCHDAMNDDESYSRVLIRKKIIPLMRKINPSVARTVSKNALLFQEIENHCT